MNAMVAQLRADLGLIRPLAKKCAGFEGRPTMNGTAFFPGGDGLWKPDYRIMPEFPVGGVLVLGSDFGDEDSYDEQFAHQVECREEINGPTWRNLLKLIDLTGIPRDRLFCTNAWPCLREGGRAVGGDVPAARDRNFTHRCQVFFRKTLALMRPRLVVPLGIHPTSFIASLEGDERAPWGNAKSWRQIDVAPIWRRQDFSVVPIVHPSMPNRHYRRAKTIEAEVELIKSALGK